LIPEEKSASAQFNRFSASMRHNFKVGSLNHKAFDAYLTALLNSDQDLVDDALDFMHASLGFINVGYINNELLIERVVPIIREIIRHVEHDGLEVTDEKFVQIRNHFSEVFRELEQIERNIYIGTQKLYTRQQLTKKRWQYFYMLISLTALLGFFAITILAWRQRRLISSLRENEQKLKIEIKERLHAEEEKGKLAEQLHQAKKMETIGLMAGGVAHDLNNILSGVVGYPELLLMNLPPESSMRRPIEAIQDSGNRAVMVVEDLLTVARGAATIKENHDLSAIVEEYMESPEFLKLQKLYPSISFKNRIEGSQFVIYCSSVHVKKCVMNLVTNAAEAIEREGTVTIAVSNNPPDKETHDGRKEDNSDVSVVLTIQDSGSGISDEDVKHIFDPFYTKKVLGRSGTGLGLTVVWNTVEDHKGRVSVESTGEGTFFHLCFPLSRGERASMEMVDEGEFIAGNQEHILVVDDEAQLRDLSSQMLRNLGYKVDAVSSGEQAISFLKEKPVDLVVLDMLMEPGMNGCQTYEEIVRLNPGQKAIIASGFSESEDVKITLQLGASEFIKKPYSINQLGLAVKSAIAG